MFIQEYLSVANAVLPVFMIMILGGILRHKKYLTEEVDSTFLKLVVNLFFPCLIFDVVLGNPVLRQAENVFTAPILGSLSILIGVGLCSLLIFILAPKTVQERQSFIYATSIYNYGYIGISLTQLIFDRATVGVLFVFNLGVEITMWSFASLLLQGTTWKEFRKVVLNPPALAIITAVVVNALIPEAYFPSFLKNGFHVIGGCAIPIALLVIGATIADFLPQMNWRQGMRTMVSAVFFRLLLIPIAFLLTAWAFPMSSELKKVLIVQASMPAAMLPIVIIKQHEGDVATALRVLLSTTAVSLITIPLVIRLGIKLCGLS